MPVRAYLYMCVFARVFEWIALACLCDGLLFRLLVCVLVYLCLVLCLIGCNVVCVCLFV